MKEEDKQTDPKSKPQESTDSDSMLSSDDLEIERLMMEFIRLPMPTAPDEEG